MDFEDRQLLSQGRFVLLRHEMPPGAARGSHWDLMLETGPQLLAFELVQMPIHEAHHQTGRAPKTEFALPVTRLPDHRPLYLDYEGAISGSRGQVIRVASGEFTLTTLPSGLCECRLSSSAGSATFRLPHHAQIPIGEPTHFQILQWQIPNSPTR